MNADETTQERMRFFGIVANGNELARQWLVMFFRFSHEIDDICDLPDFAPKRILALLAYANGLYSHPFYQKHRHRLTEVILLATSIYQLSNQWEKEPALWKRWWADVFRHSGNDVILVVARICGGFEHQMKLAGPLSAVCYTYHADRYGTPDNPLDNQSDNLIDRKQSSDAR